MRLFENNRVEGIFIKRENRFIAQVEINNTIHKVHVPNTGRMKELLVKGARVHLKYHPAPHKKTSYTLISVEKDGILVCIDSRVANQIFFDYIAIGKLEYYSNIKKLKREVKYSKSRFDIAFMEKDKQVLIEVKSVNLVKDNHGFFPDAPTIRGNKHVQELMAASEKGIETGVIFIIQRPDAKKFSPYWEMDPKFSKSLKEASLKGVLIKAYNCDVSKEEININTEIPIIF